jgi:uncharacterized membrane protein (UPF0127 family)
LQSVDAGFWQSFNKVDQLNLTGAFEYWSNGVLHLSVHNCYIIGFRGIVVVLSFILVILSVKTMACPLELPTSTISIKGYTLIAELATTPTARNCGLSNRVKLPKNQGMLFIFPFRRPRTFWMKDTYIPLSIAFLDDSGKIINIQNMVPMQTDELYYSSQPVKYALEVNQGWFNAHGIEVGDTVEMKLPLVIDIR